MLEALAYKRGFEPDEEGLFAAALAWPRVLDLFAGSGALGIEALSRGAAHATFLEADRDAARVIDGNLRVTGLAERATVLLGPAQLTLSRARGPFHLVLADPPYRDAEALNEAVGRLPPLLVPNSIVVLEQPAKDEPPDRVGELTLATTRHHGGTRISLYAG
jgi:16S rRNA (guanine966-N2)-methyltransferase